MSVFQGLSAGKTWQPPIVGGELVIRLTASGFVGGATGADADVVHPLVKAAKHTIRKKEDLFIDDDLPRRLNCF
jgi:hypothetical protein